MTSRLLLLFFIAGSFPLIDQCTQPKTNDVKKESIFLRVQSGALDPCSFTSHEVWIYCTFFGLQWFHDDSTPPRFCSSSWRSYIFISNVLCKNHINVQLIFLSKDIVMKRSSGGLTKSAATCISATYYKNQIHKLECIQSSLPTPRFFLLDDAWSLEHGVTHKRSNCQVTGEAAPLVPIIPVNPLHRHHCTSNSTHSPC